MNHSFVFGRAAILALLVLFACSSDSVNNLEAPNATNFSDYWYQGKAEITSYDLQQARYGEVHKGTAVLIYVTEPFSPNLQTKADYPEKCTDDVSVLKLNFTKDFNTGIYPYHMMSSIFTPVHREEGDARTIRVATGSQEWCGHTYTNLKRVDSGYEAQLFSYFEGESVAPKEIYNALLEDELWNLIRINPAELPQGEVLLIPGTMFQRLRHTPLKAYQAMAKLSEASGKSTFKLEYPELQRSLSITFSSKFPHEILEWEESYPSGFGADAKIISTKASKKKSIFIDYWTKNSVSDMKYRKELGL